jgi:NADH dehydrogenase FAD-containing subunit
MHCRISKEKRIKNKTLKTQITKNTDVLVIRGSAAGMVAAVTGKNSWTEKNFILVKKQKHVMVPCGIPYIFGTLDSSQLNIMPVDNMLEKAGIESLVNEVVSIDKQAKIATLDDGEQIKYDKLFIATGSKPIKPKWLKGNNLENVFVIPKNKVYLDSMKEKINNLKKVVVIGAGELTNVIGIAIQNRMSINSLLISQISTHPCLTASPAAYPLIKIAEIIASKIRNI